jgi:hypothetical protein
LSEDRTGHEDCKALPQPAGVWALWAWSVTAIALTPALPGGIDRDQEYLGTDYALLESLARRGEIRFRSSKHYHFASHEDRNGDPGTTAECARESCSAKSQERYSAAPVRLPHIKKYLLACPSHIFAPAAGSSKVGIDVTKVSRYGPSE